MARLLSPAVLLERGFSSPHRPTLTTAVSHHPHDASMTHRHASGRQVALGKLASPDPVVLAIAVAERYWGAVPCGGQITVLADMPLAAGPRPHDRRLGHVQLLARAERPRSAGRHLYAVHDLTCPLAVADAGGHGRATGTCSA